MLLFVSQHLYKYQVCSVLYVDNFLALHGIPSVCHYVLDVIFLALPKVSLYFDSFFLSDLQEKTTNECKLLYDTMNVASYWLHFSLWLLLLFYHHSF